VRVRPPRTNQTTRLHPRVEDRLGDLLAPRTGRGFTSERLEDINSAANRVPCRTNTRPEQAIAKRNGQPVGDNGNNARHNAHAGRGGERRLLARGERCIKTHPLVANLGDKEQQSAGGLS